jgi:hypothetical protein
MYVFKNTDLMTIYDALTGGSGSNTILNGILNAINFNNPSAPNGTNYILFNALRSSSLSQSVADSLQKEISGTDYDLIGTQVDSGKTTAEWLTSANSILTNIATYNNTIRTPNIRLITGTSTISGQLHSLSVYNSGAASGTIDTGAGAVSIPAGVTVNFDAGGNNNRFPTNVFVLNATGTSFIITTVG